MQQEIDATDTTRPVQILALNQDGNQTDYNAPGAFCDGRDLPFLEEGPGDGVWSSWGVTYRDVYVLDGDGNVVTVFNLTENDLGVPANYDALATILLEAADAE